MTFITIGVFEREDIKLIVLSEVVSVPIKLEGTFLLFTVLLSRWALEIRKGT